MGSRTAELVLGIIGGIFGLFAAIIALVVGGIGSAVGAEGGSTVVGLGWLAILCAIVGIVGAALVNSKTQIAGILMLLSALGGFISISFFWLLPGVLLLIAGLLALIRKGDV